MTLSFAHYDFGPVSSDMHFIHELVNEEDATPMIGIDVFAYQRTGNLKGVVAVSWITNNDQDPVFFVARHAAIDLLR